MSRHNNFFFLKKKHYLKSINKWSECCSFVEIFTVWDNDVTSCNLYLIQHSYKCLCLYWLVSHGLMILSSCSWELTWFAWLSWFKIDVYLGQSFFIMFVIDDIIVLGNRILCQACLNTVTVQLLCNNFLLLSLQMSRQMNH